MRTALGPLHARAEESRDPGGIFRDPPAEWLAAAMSLDRSGLNWPLYQGQIAVRTEIIDAVVCGFLAVRPAGVVATLGAGIDTRPWRLDNGEVRWFDLDLPEVAALRRRHLPGDDRHATLDASVLDPRWTRAIPRGGPLLFVVEGLLNYLAEGEARTLLRDIAMTFPDSEIVLETLGYLLVRLAGLPQYRRRTSAENLPQNWDPGFEELGSWCVFERHRERWDRLPELRLLAAFGRNLESICHLRPRPAVGTGVR